MNGQTSITLGIDLSRVIELRPTEKPYAIGANQHDAVEVYVVQRNVLPDGEVLATVHAFSVSGDWLTLKVEGEREP